jgi:hypothetical protein
MTENNIFELSFGFSFCAGLGDEAIKEDWQTWAQGEMFSLMIWFIYLVLGVLIFFEI